MKDYLKVEPESLVKEVAKPRLVICLVIAFIFTLVFIGATSIFFIKDCFTYNTIYPVKAKRDLEKAEKEKQEAEAKKQRELEEQQAAKQKAKEAEEKKAREEENKKRSEEELKKIDARKKPAAEKPAQAPVADDQNILPSSAGMDFSTL